MFRSNFFVAIFVIANSINIFGASFKESLEAEVRKFNEVPLPIEERVRQMEELARKGDVFSVEVLFALVNTPNSSGLNLAALSSLGLVQNPDTANRVVEFLKRRIKDETWENRAVALKGYVRLAGDKALPVLGDLLKEIRKEPLAEQTRQLRSAAVESLALLGTEGAAKLLVSELAWVGEKPDERNLEYGAQIIDSLTRLAPPDYLKDVSHYAAALEANIPENSYEKESFERKIKELKKIIALEEQRAKLSAIKK
jgi:hypothetical protein